MQVPLIEKIARWLTLILIASLPFFFVPVAGIALVTAKATLAAVCISLALLLWLIGRLLSGGIRIPGSAIIWSALAIPLVYILSALFAGWTEVSLFGGGVDQDTVASIMLAVAALVLSAVAFAFDARRAVYALRAFFIGVLALFFMQAILILAPSVTFLSFLSGPAGNALGSWHEFGILSGIVLVVAVMLAHTRVGGGTWKYLFYCCAILAAGFLLIGNFFDVWIGVLVCSLVLVLSNLRVSFATPANISLIAIVVLSLSMAIFGTFVHGKLPSRLQVTDIEARPSLMGTLVIGREALDSPTTLLFGSGPNTFRHAWGLYKPAEINQTIFWNESFRAGYGFVPTSLVSTGILGILAWLTLIASFLWGLGVAVFRVSPLPEAGAIARTLGIAASYLLAFLVMYVPGPALTILTFLFGGLFVAFLYHAQVIRAREYVFSGGIVQNSAIASAAIGTLIVVIATAGVLRVLASEVMVNRAIIHYNATQDIEASSAGIQQALRIYPSSDRAHRAAVELGLIQLGALANASSTDEVRATLQTSLEGTIKHGLDAVRINGDYQNWLQLAALYQNLAGVQIEGAETQAREAYQKALAENPNNPLPHLYIAQLDLLQKNGDSALEHLATATRLKPDFAPAYYLASQIYAAAGDFKSAQEVAIKAVEFAQDDALAWYNLGAIAFANKDFETAAAAEGQAVAREPQYADALFVLGLSYYELKRTEEAIKVFETLDALSPGQEAVRSVLENLRAGKPPVPEVATTTPAR